MFGRNKGKEGYERPHTPRSVVFLFFFVPVKFGTLISITHSQRSHTATHTCYYIRPFRRFFHFVKRKGVLTFEAITHGGGEVVKLLPSPLGQQSNYRSS